MSKNKALLAAALLMGASLQARVVTVNSQQLLMETSRGQQLQKDLMADNQKLQELQQSLQASLAQKSQELQGRLDMLTPEARNKEVAALEMEKRRAERQLREAQEDVQFAAQQRQAEVQGALMLTAKNVCLENNEDALLDAANPSVLAFNPDCDITAQVAERDNAVFQQESESLQADQADSLQTT